MTFDSYSFSLIFLPVMLLTFALAGFVGKGSRACCALLLVLSFVFYSGGRADLILFLAGEILINYILGFILSRYHSRPVLAASIILNLGVLCFFKYTGMALGIINVLFGTNLAVTVPQAPPGISFITFQQIAFLVFSYGREDRDRDLLSYSVYTSFFPHISQGPILEPDQYLNGRLRDMSSKLSWESLSEGFFLFVIGLSKKIFLANAYGSIVDAAYNNLAAVNTGTAIAVSLAYTLQIYFDFSGYSDMAMGLGRMVNIDIPLNFNSPYKSASIGEFWDRWHITLTRFFTRYLYIPLGGNRKGKARTMINIMIVFLVSGLWHGANLTFVLWGACHGLFMVLERRFKDRLFAIPRVVSQVFVFLFVNFAWVLFRAGSLTNLKAMTGGFLNKGMLIIPEVEMAFNRIGVFEFGYIGYQWPVWLFILIGLGIVFGTANSVEMLKKCRWRIPGAIAAAVLFLLCVFSFTDKTSYVYLMF